MLLLSSEALLSNCWGISYCVTYSGDKITFASGTSLTVHSSKCTDAITINWRSKKLYKSKFAHYIFSQYDSDPQVKACYWSTIYEYSYSRTVKHFMKFIAALKSSKFKISDINCFEHNCVLGIKLKGLIILPKLHEILPRFALLCDTCWQNNIWSRHKAECRLQWVFKSWPFSCITHLSSLTFNIVPLYKTI